jgi:putative hydrolase of the HAD superfamily
MQDVRALTFDLDDTLWDNRPVLMAAERTLYDWLVENYPDFRLHYELEDMLVLRQQLLQEDPELRNDVSQLRKRSLRIAAHTAGYDDSLVEPAFAVFLEARHRITPYDDVEPALRKLRRAGYCLGSLTNGNTDIHRLALGPLFDFSLSAGTIGKAKPHPRMFEEACRRAGVSPAQLAHVGDEADTDLAGARNAGALAIWMNRQGQRPAADALHHAEVRNMEELLDLLQIN